MKSKFDYELSLNETSYDELKELSREVHSLSMRPRQDEDLESRVRMACNPMMDGDAGPDFTHSLGAALNFISQLLNIRAEELARLNPSYFKR